MNLRMFLSERGTSQQAFAADLGVSQTSVSQWVGGVAVPPPIRCVEIEQLTEGCVTRRDLRPDDWWRIWPELVREGDLPSPGADAHGQRHAAQAA